MFESGGVTDSNRTKYSTVTGDIILSSTLNRCYEEAQSVLLTVLVHDHTKTTICLVVISRG